MQKHESFSTREQPISIEELQWTLMTCSDELVGWHDTQDAHSPITQGVRRRTFIETGTILQGLIQDANRENYQIVLTTGQMEVHSFSFIKSSDKFTRREVNTVGPGTEIVINDTALRRMDATDRPRPKEFYQEVWELYLGDPTNQLPLSTLAKTLAEDGSLRVARADTDQTAA